MLLEVNGAADFSPEYSLGTNVYDAVVAALERRLTGAENPRPPQAAAAAAI